MDTVTVNTPAARYDISIGAQQLARLQEIISAFKPTRLAVISNPAVMSLYGAQVTQACARLAPVSTVLVEDGEHAKSMESLARVLGLLADARLDRASMVVALGGGVVGDLAGFAAAVYMRGIRFVQVPTTLLAQVDSSVGGKTGVNLAQGKNLVGAFHQPVAVLADTSTLRSLPPRELSAGLAEVIKHGLLADAAYLQRIESDMPALLRFEEEALGHAVAGSCRIKADIVSRDEREAGQRALLNLGHTFGHAIENLSGYGTWLHGEAVAVGLCLAADLSKRLGLIGAEDVTRVQALVRAAQLPTSVSDIRCADMLEAMRADKKAYGGEVHFVVLARLGHAVSRPVHEALVLETLKDNGFCA